MTAQDIQGWEKSCRAFGCAVLSQSCGETPASWNMALVQNRDELSVWNGQCFIFNVFSSVNPTHAQNKEIYSIS